MTAESSKSRVYHVSRWRRWLLLWTIGPIILGLVIGAMFAPAADAKALLATAGTLILIMLPFQLLVDRTKLKISSEGVRLKQTGYTLETPWTNVAGMRLMRASEAFITTAPMTGKGVERLAKMRTFGMIGAPLYDAEQQALLAEHRLIPIEAFAWHLRHGKLRDDIVRFAPHLKEALVALDDADAPDQRSTSKDIWKILLMVSPFIIGAIALAESPQAIQDRIIGVASLVLLPLLTFRMAYSAWTSFRTRAWIMGIFFVLLTVISFLWSVSLWIDFNKAAP